VPAEPAHPVLAALLDDLNTPAAITELHGLVSDSREGSKESRIQLAASLKFLGLVPQDWLKNHAGRAAEGVAALQEIRKNLRANGVDIDSLIDARNAARKAKDFKESDRIRDELAAMGVVLKDSKDGTTWEIAR
jgi:cysteinyl-tRNA synthetase